MGIDAVIYCFNDAPLADCLNCPHFFERSGSRAGCRIKRMGEARKIVEKYQKIEQIMSADLEHIHHLDRDKYIVASIKKILQEDNDDKS